MNTLILLAVLFAVILLWMDGARAREVATAVCLEACRRNQVQLLEGTVFLKRFAPRWSNQGLKFRRMFQFDYSSDGADRLTGNVILLGMQLEAVYIDTPGGTTIEGEATRED